MRLIGVLLLVLLVAGCGGDAPSGGGSPARSSSAGTAARSRDWTRFGYDAARTSDAPRGIAPDALGGLREHRVALPGTVDSSPILVAGTLVMTTSYGRTVGLDPHRGRIRWTFTPRGYRSVAGTEQITTATPVADPDRRFVYAASPDGRIHKLRVANGREVRSGGWPASVTRDATHEKIASALNLSGRFVLVTTGGYIGDAPPYQGKVVAISRRTGRIVHVVNSLCSDRRRIIVPRTCGASDSAIWGRAGAVVDPKDHHIYVATGNAPWNGSTNWGDSVLELSPGAGRLLRHYTPREQESLEASDADLGSTAPALLPAGRGRAYLAQGGKDLKLRLLALRGSLHGVRGAAGRRLGGERQVLPVVGDTRQFTAPAVRGRTMYVATGGGTAAYRLRSGRLHRVWSNGTAGTSPLLAGEVLWVYDPDGALNAYRPGDGHLLHHWSAPDGHWNSPIVAEGRVYLPTGSANDHATSGSLSIFAR
jgi:outer membrane protein assembly factor BamB